MKFPPTPNPHPDSRPFPKRRVLRTWFVAGLIMATGMTGWWAKGKGFRVRAMELAHLKKAHRPRPHVAVSRPGNAEGNVPVNTTITADIKLRNGPLVAQSVTADSVTLLRTRDQSISKTTVTMPTNGRIEVRPAMPLEPNTGYTLYFTDKIKDMADVTIAPAAISFTTAGSADPALRFEKVELPAAAGVGFTSLVIGPDHKLYAGSDDGRIFRFTISRDGGLSSPRVITSLQSAGGGPRLLSGFCFDPASTPEQPVAWAAHSFFGFKDVPDWTGRISRLSGPNLEDVQDVIVNLPRSARDHITHQPVFGPDGAIYFNQGSNSTSGAPDTGWSNRPERLLSASILRLDPRKLPQTLPLDVRTRDGGGTYDPSNPNAPLTIYATGVRVAFDLVWTRDGKLYAPTNGSTAAGNTPAGMGAPAIDKLALAEDDWLNRITPGGYYGHPNPSQKHFILNGGNPTAGHDYAEVPEYPIGTQPDADWTRAIYDFGKHISPNGVIQYAGDAFGGKLDGALLVCRYNLGGDIIALRLDRDGNVAATETNIPGLNELENPLDLIEDIKTGFLYVAEYGAQRITLLRPISPPVLASP